MRSNRVLLLALVLAPLPALAQDYKLVVLKEAPPSTLADPIKSTLNGEGYRALDGQGKPIADFWLRKVIPAKGKPAGPQGTVLFPVLSEGELLGLLRFPGEGRDYRDQPIAAGVYTLRYGLQPVNGDHLGVSPYRDFALLIQAAKDTAAADLAPKPLEERSAEAADSSHPAVLMFLPPPEGGKGQPSMAHDESKNTWGAVFPLSLSVAGERGPIPLPVQLVLVGTAMN